LNRVKITGFVGPAGCGKTTLSKKLNNESDNGLVFSFADNLRDVVIKTFDVTKYDLVCRKNEITHPKIEWGGEHLTHRRLMQVFGQLMRKMDEDVWVRPFYRFVESAPLNSHIFIDDVRFENEVKAIKKMKGKIIGLSREGYKLQGQAKNDVSEKLNFDFTDEVWDNNDLENIKVLNNG